MKKELEAKVVLPNKRTQASERAKNAIFVPDELDLARDQSRLLCEFVANTFRGSRDISYKQKDHRLTAPKTKPFAVHCVWQ